MHIVIWVIFVIFAENKNLMAKKTVNPFIVSGKIAPDFYERYT